jgi:hypothetical protein
MENQRYLIAVVESDGYTWRITDTWNSNFARDCCIGVASTDDEHVWNYEALKSALPWLSMTENALSAVRVSTSNAVNLRLKTSWHPYVSKSLWTEGTRTSHQCQRRPYDTQGYIKCN